MDYHPIRQGENRTQEQRIADLEYALAILWDQVWWMHLSEEKREEYRAEGYENPIKQFYVPLRKVHRRGD